MSVLGQLLNLLSSILTIWLTCPNSDTLLSYRNDPFYDVWNIASIWAMQLHCLLPTPRQHCRGNSLFLLNVLAIKLLPVSPSRYPIKYSCIFLQAYENTSRELCVHEWVEMMMSSIWPSSTPTDIRPRSWEQKYQLTISSLLCIHACSSIRNWLNVQKWML